VAEANLAITIQVGGVLVVTVERDVLSSRVDFAIDWGDSA